MARTETADIRNVAFVGHGHSGKTVLTEACLLAAKRLKRLGSTRDGTAVTDYDEQEKAQERSIDAGSTFLPWKGKHVNLVDTPGYPDSIGEAISGLWAVDAAVLVVDASAGIKVNTRQMWRQAAALGRPRAIVIARADQDHARYDDLLVEIQTAFSDSAIPYTLPVDGLVGTGMRGVEAASATGSDEARASHAALIERAVEADEDLMMLYLEGEELAPEQEQGAIAAAFRAGTLFPVFVTSGEQGHGVTELLDAIAAFFPSPADKTYAATDEDSGDPVEVKVTSPFTAKVWRINYDPFVGKLSYLRIVSGVIEPGASIRVQGAKTLVKIAHVYSVHGKDTKDLKKAVAGDLIALSKVEEFERGQTVTSADLRVVFPEPVFPEPMVGLAVETKSRADDAKIAAALGKLVSADPTLTAERNPLTHELVVMGMSNLHLDTVFARLDSRYKIGVDTHLPKISYLETVSAEAEGHYRHKKQTGGAGQFGEVYLRIEPRPRGEGFSFESKVVGGAISSSFLPSIEKGIRQVMADGIICGFKFVDVAVLVYDGKEHPVDSKDIAFQIAGRNAFKDAVHKAKPVLLEPIADVEIVAHADHMGALMGDINTRRGRIQTSENDGDHVTIRAQIPEAEMQTYSNELRSLTGGEGTFHMRRSHYDPTPQHVAKQVIAKYSPKDA